VRHGAGHRFPERRLEGAARLVALAREWDTPPAQLALAWLCDRPAVASAIVGPETEAQLEALAPAADLRLSEAQTEALDQLWSGAA
jgi:aryl-alcohol dehydrogenase-like predicted oxidoreductase